MDNLWVDHIFGKWGRVKNAKPEDTICIELCNTLRAYILNKSFNGVFFHVENETGGKRSVVYNLLKKLTGKIAGAPDYIFINTKHTLLIEMKAPGKKQSKNQKMFQAWCDAMGIKYYVCFSSKEVEKLLQEHGFIV